MAKSRKKSSKPVPSSNGAPKKIGEGGYGCVHRPALRCMSRAGSDKLNYDNKVSKILQRQHAESEIEEFKLLHEIIDPHGEFTLARSKQYICAPNKTQKNIKAISYCDDKSDYLDSSSGRAGKINVADDSRLIVMDFAGESLSKLAKQLAGKRDSSLMPPSGTSNKRGRRKNSKSKGKKKMLEAHLIVWPRFFAEVVFMFIGVETLLEKKFLHHDLKPQNILYELSTQRMTMIDFGLMKSFATFESRLQESSLSTTFHFSYPLEYYFMTRARFKRLIHRNVPFAMKTMEPSDLQKYTSALSTFINYSDSSTLHSDRLNKDFTSFFAKLAAVTSSDADKVYETLVLKFRDCFDCYGLGFSLQYILVSAKTAIGNDELYFALHELFYSMYTPDLFVRLDIYSARKKYCAILDQFSIPYTISRNNNNVAIGGGGNIDKYANVPRDARVKRSFHLHHDIEDLSEK